jgi:hypothetical protein
VWIKSHVERRCLGVLLYDIFWCRNPGRLWDLGAGWSDSCWLDAIDSCTSCRRQDFEGRRINNTPKVEGFNSARTPLLQLNFNALRDEFVCKLGGYFHIGLIRYSTVSIVFQLTTTASRGWCNLVSLREQSVLQASALLPLPYRRSACAIALHSTWRTANSGSWGGSAHEENESDTVYHIHQWIHCPHPPWWLWTLPRLATGDPEWTDSCG